MIDLLKVVRKIKYLIFIFCISSCCINSAQHETTVMLPQDKRIKQPLFKAENKPAATIQEAAEETFDFRKVIQESKIGKKQVSGNSNDIQYFTTYLGEIKPEKEKTVYHAISQFYNVQAAISKHGHSKVIFLDDQKRIAEIYELDMPNQLPISIESNQLVFELNGMTSKLKIEKMPEMLCLPLYGECFE